MPASLIARSLTVIRGPLVVLDDVELTLAPGHRVGLVGPNGVGKSTLLAALAGRVDLERGSVEAAPRTANVGLLPQEPERSATETVREFLARRSGVAPAQVELDAATAALAVGEAGADDRYSDALDRWLALGAADFDARVGEVWHDLGLGDRLLDQPTLTLSGGEAARSSLASLLLSRFDVFLLDEPTNDLDLDGLDRLERWVLGLDAPVLLVSHDRSFLGARSPTSSRSTTIRTGRRGSRVGGSRSSPSASWPASTLVSDSTSTTQSVRRSQQRAQREREWATQGQAKVQEVGRERQTHPSLQDQPDRATRRQGGSDAEGGGTSGDRGGAPRPVGAPLVDPDVGRSGDVVAMARGAVVERGTFQLGPIDLDIRLGDRVALVGPNGSGKTTLISLLLGRVSPEVGTATLGSSVVVGEIEQARSALLGDESLVDAFTAATGLQIGEARTLLAKFGLGAEHVHRGAGNAVAG